MTKNRQKTTDALKNQIADALLMLLKKKPLDKITIDELTAKADVGRATYFRYFKSKRDVITFRLLSLWKQFQEQHVRNKDPESPFADYARCCFDFCYEIRDLHILLFQTNNEDILLQTYLMFFSSDDHAPWQDRYYNSFYAYGLFGLLKEWVVSGYQESPAEIASFYMEHFNYREFMYLHDSEPGQDGKFKLTRKKG